VRASTPVDSKLSYSFLIDIHESSNFDRNAYLTEGMVITIEPGVYVPPNTSFPMQYHNLGIRIEVGIPLVSIYLFIYVLNAG
jgi:Xaa-Pro aminopeptidase